MALKLMNNPLRIKSFPVKLFLSFFLLTSGIILVLSASISSSLRENHIQSTIAELANYSLLAEKALWNNHTDGATLQQRARDFSGSIRQLRLTVINPDGTVIAESEIADPSGMENHRYRPEVREALEKGSGSNVRYSNTLACEMLYFAKNTNHGVIRLARPLSEMDTFIHRIRMSVLTSGGFSILASLIIIIYLTWSISRPVRETVSFAEKFAAGDFSQRIMDYNDNEIGLLQQSLNRLADNLQSHITDLLTEQAKLDNTITSIEDGIALVDPHGKIILSNPAFERIFRLRNTTKKRFYFELIRSSELNTIIHDGLHNWRALRTDVQLQSGEFCELQLNPVEEKDFKALLLVFHDVTERKRLEIMKTELIGNLSHELKTPLAIIRGYLETIELQLPRVENTAQIHEMISKALQNTGRLNSIISDMLKLNMLETTRDFPAEELVLPDLIDVLLEMLSPKISTSKLEIIRYYPDKPETCAVQANRFLAEQVFFNLLDNAINYNRQAGSITVTVCQNGHDWSVNITDTGVGIPALDTDRIFERFYRVNKGRSRESGGTGLGLAIVKHALGLLNWGITLRSDQNGSTFTVLVPHC